MPLLTSNTSSIKDQIRPHRIQGPSFSSPVHLSSIKEDHPPSHSLFTNSTSFSSEIVSSTGLSHLPFCLRGMFFLPLLTPPPAKLITYYSSFRLQLSHHFFPGDSLPPFVMQAPLLCIFTEISPSFREFSCIYNLLSFV